MSKQKKQMLSNLLSVIFFIGCFAFSAYLTHSASQVLIDSDSASELVLAQHLSQKNAILSTDWCYSTELRVLNTQLIFAPLFKIFSDWSTIRFVGAMLLQGILVASYWYFTRSLRIQTRYFFYTAAFLVLPTSVAYTRIIQFHSYYVPHLTLGFLLMGQFCSLINTPRYSHRSFRRKLLLPLFCLLSFLSCLGGFRQLLITHIPLVLLCFLLFLPLFRSQKSKGWRALFQTTQGRCLGYSALGLLCGGAGYLVNAKILPMFFLYKKDFGQLNLLTLDFEFIQTILNDTLHLFGYRSGIPLLSLNGICSVLGIFCACLVFYLCIRFYRRRAEFTSMPAAIVSLFFSVSFLLNTLVFCLVQFYARHYYVPVFVYIFPMFALMLSNAANKEEEQSTQRSGVGTRALVFCILAVFGLNSFFTGRNFLQTRPGCISSNAQEPLLFSKINEASNISGAASYLMEQGYTFGYATFWNANIVTELTDGAIEIADITDLPTPHFHRWLTRKDYWLRDYHKGKLFLLLTQEQAESIKESDLILAGELVYSDSLFVIYSYEDDKAFAQTLNYLPPKGQ